MQVLEDLGAAIWRGDIHCPAWPLCKLTQYSFVYRARTAATCMELCLAHTLPKAQIHMVALLGDSSSSSSSSS